MEEKIKPLIMDSFCFRDFDREKRPETFIDYSKEDFTKKVNAFYSKDKLKDGYAPFCKHIFMPNFVPGLKSRTLPITKEIEPLIISAYEARTPNELPVLNRYIEISSISHLTFPDAKYLDIILYSKEQIVKEKIAMKETDLNQIESIDFDYGIISLKPQDADYELPMTPITMMRNALGITEGGSGIPLNKEVYLASVEYWSKHILTN